MNNTLNEIKSQKNNLPSFLNFLTKNNLLDNDKSKSFELQLNDKKQIIKSFVIRNIAYYKKL